MLFFHYSVRLELYLSGAGKTTLLNAIVGRNMGKLIVSGSVEINGEAVDNTRSQLFSFVQQEDLFMETLTVREHLIFQVIS